MFFPAAVDTHDTGTGYPQLSSAEKYNIRQISNYFVHKIVIAQV